MKDLTFVDTDAKGTPFSFLHYIFWNRKIDFESAQGQQIFKHELIHVKEKHSVDKLFLQLVLIVFWINPFFWIIRKELTMIHEFIADRKSVKDSDASALAAMILTAAFPGHTLSLTNPFFYSPIKRRLLMLSKLQNPKVGYISRLLLLPLLTILFTAFALKIKEKDATSRIPLLERSLTVVIDAGHGLNESKPHGAIGLNGISEDEIALAISKKIEQLNTDKNLKLIFTRKDESYIDANERVKITSENSADLFISIHASFVPPLKKDGKEIENPANGFELYVAKEGTSNLEQSKTLGSSIINEMKTIIAIREPAIKQRQTGIFVLTAVPCPAVLLECGFVSNSKDIAFLTNEKNQEKIAEAVLKGIVNYATAKHQNTATTLHTSPITKDTLPKTEIVIPQGTPIFTKAEIMPAFPGGENAWNRYMEKIIRENIDALTKEGKEGMCEVEFIVTPEGFVNKVKAKTMQNTKLAEVFIESIKKGPTWIPATQNGRKVHCWSTQKLTLRLPVSKNAPISVANAYMQNLFIGIDNPLVISMGNTPGIQLQVTSNNGTVTKLNGTWVARPSFAGKATITVTDPKSNQEAKVIFTVKELAVPVITLGDSKGGRIAANKITESKQLTIDEDWEIANYTMYFTGKGFDNPYFIAANKSPEFNKSVLEAIAKCQPGTTIVIDEIIIKQGNTKKTSAPLAFNLY
ncbi:N-acetylmuramoyl-L-alanine amidase [Lacibacter sp.]|uniref:N-acetylmuramoyl-L-alanine amidase n=1 Tax=Lacibacter sp. TaxID=1915409 RepID=UPI002B4B2EAE|nr:N-acetylmuramoyl-L-alanine amidase [Lacibacter sp.]HLP36664.1 N-acetylmuramoyl-L-alanine amidase [Lacibacter sp.]